MLELNNDVDGIDMILIINKVHHIYCIFSAVDRNKNLLERMETPWRFLSWPTHMHRYDTNYYRVPE